MDNRLVEIRTTDAFESLQLVQSALSMATGRKNIATALKEGLSRLRSPSSLEKLDDLIRYCDAVLQEALPLERDHLATTVTDAAQALKEVKEQLMKLQDSASQLAQFHLETRQLETHKKLIENKLHEKRGLLRQITDGPAQDVLSRIEKAKPAWGEHLEAVSGLVLRENQFDRGLSVLADCLINHCQDFYPFATAETVNILGRDRVVVKDLPHTVYFRFPTWSVWGLPLNAHEFWHAASEVVWKDPSFKSLLDKIPQGDIVWKDPLLQDCLADAFATIAVGPAYAFACILLLLDATSDDDRIRAESIFDSLKHLAKGNPLHFPFVLKLEKDWRDAIGARTPSTSPDTSTPRALVQKSIPAVNSALFEFIDEKLTYSPKEWAGVEDKLIPLLNAPEGNQWETKLEEYRASVKPDLRHILHAGWRCRWESKMNDKDCVATLAIRVKRLCDEAARRANPSALAPDRNGPIQLLKRN